MTSTRLLLALSLILTAPAITQELPWSWRPLERPATPRVRVSHPVDAFVRAELEKHGLGPSERVDRATLLRRVCIDLTGLPPTRERLERFLADDRPDAWERLVDTLLNDPGFGETWARHWLDVARYADTHGFDKDKVRQNAWPYRDWVVRALNQAMPFARFAAWQIAGDAIAPDDPDATRATGFVAAGPWDFVGQVELREGTRDKRITRTLDRDEMVTGVMSAMLGTTAHCARCHDHKFDPITQRDYYALQAVFAGVDRADRRVDNDAATLAKRRELDLAIRAAEAALARIERALPDALLPEERALFAEREALRARLEAQAPDARTSPTNGFHGPVATTPDEEQWVTVHLEPPRPVDVLRLWPARPVDFPDTPDFGFPLRYRIEIAAVDPDGEHLVTIDPTHRDRERASDRPRTAFLGGVTVRSVRIVATLLRERRRDYVFALSELELIHDGENLARGSRVTASGSIEAGLWSRAHLVDGFTSHHRIEGSAWMRERARLSELEARCEELVTQRRSVAEHLALTEAREQRSTLEHALAALPERTPCYAITTTFPPNGNFTPPGEHVRPVHVLARGDVDRALERARPGGLAALDALAPSSFGDVPPDDEAAARRALAHWITRDENPLFWRVSVNRVWQHLIGRPIVETPNDFGHMGASPSHRELLDWLACTLRDGELSWKELVRVIVTTETYRQSSSSHARGLALDESNRLVWRMNRKRLSAEALRDALLFTAQRLDRTMGGPGFRAFLFEDDHSPRYLYERHDPLDPAVARRSIYRMVVRSVRQPFLEALDDPDPCSSVGKRDETLTPLQALTLANHPFVLAQAHALESHLTRCPPGSETVLDWLYGTILLRAPTAWEREAVGAYLDEHGIAATARLLWNTNEFLYVD